MVGSWKLWLFGEALGCGCVRWSCLKSPLLRRMLIASKNLEDFSEGSVNIEEKMSYSCSSVISKRKLMVLTLESWCERSNESFSKDVFIPKSLLNYMCLKVTVTFGSGQMLPHYNSGSFLTKMDFSCSEYLILLRQVDV